MGISLYYRATVPLHQKVFFKFAWEGSQTCDFVVLLIYISSLYHPATVAPLHQQAFLKVARGRIKPGILWFFLFMLSHFTTQLQWLTFTGKFLFKFAWEWNRTWDLVVIFIYVISLSQWLPFTGSLF